MILSDEEDIARAICSDKFDSATGRVSTSLFKGPHTSVSRLSILPLSGQWHRLASTVQKLPGLRLERIGTIRVGMLREIGRGHTANEKPHPVNITVVAKPEPWNDAHAEVENKLSDGMCKRVNCALEVHAPPSGFDPEKVPRVIP